MNAGPALTFQASPIHGQGGFAAESIPAGARVLEYVGEKITKRESTERCRRANHCIFHLDEEWNLDGDVAWNVARLLNHSCAPNSTAELIDGRIWIVAARDLRAGEEITFNYGYDLQDFEEHPCRCGAAECVGFIVAEDFFPDVRRAQAGRA
ncbi:MAG: SET domain-containing protein [Pedosphaera sp.]|nr:SET domain-containing protein [Pedosphaera sp.]